MNAVVRGDQTIVEGHLAYGVPAEARPCPLTDAQREQVQENGRHYTDLGERFVDAGPHEHPSD